MLGNRSACVKRPPQRGRDCLKVVSRRTAGLRDEQADRRDAAGARSRDSLGSLHSHSADREDRNCAQAARRFQVVERRQGVSRIFRRRLKQRAEDQVGDAAGA